ncbi:hypothetical protein QZH41_020052 [Actinostola sp. cb2023]|nr:hypothetical protein QZH41_020052 [Actinostola sp. cb2023]
MTSWFHVPSRIVLATLALHPVGFLWCYQLLEKRRDKIRMSGYFSMDNKVLQKLEYLSFKSKLRHTCSILPQIVQIFLSFLFNDMVVSGVTTTIAFESSPFSPADHYKYYLILSFGGLCLGRSYLGLVEIIKPGMGEKILIRRTISAGIEAYFYTDIDYMRRKRHVTNTSCPRKLDVHYNKYNMKL